MEVNRVAMKSNGEDNYDEEKNVSGANDGAQSAASTVNSQTTTQQTGVGRKNSGEDNYDDEKNVADLNDPPQTAAGTIKISDMTKE